MSSIESAIAVTGIGVISPVGIGCHAFWSALSAGSSGIRPITKFPVPEGGPRLGAEIEAFDARGFVHSVHLRRMDSFSRMIVSACRLALDDAGDVLGDRSSDGVAVVVGSAFGNLSESLRFLERVFRKGPSVASPMVFPNLVLNAAASYVAMELGLMGENFTVTQGEISAEWAIIQACDLLRSGRAEVVLAGGGDELAAILYAGYRGVGALSSQRGGSERSCPYDVERNGVVLGEGGAMFVLESVAHAQRRGAAVYATIEAEVPFSVPAVPYDWPVSAAAALPVLRKLIGSAGPDLIVGAGNSSRRLDACEMDLYRALLAERAKRTWLTSVRGAVGEFGAAGALGFAAACLALRHGSVRPVAGLTRPDPRLRLRLARRIEPARLDRVMITGLGRGGNGVALLLRNGRLTA